MFYTGQKVARWGGGATRDVPYPAVGEICTVVNVYMARNEELMLELAEYPNAETDAWFAGFRAYFFRPIVERKTDISIFKRMLVPGPKVTEPVSCA